MKLEYEVVQPSAVPVIQALRSIGYVPEAAVADLVDNSLDARAKNVVIDMVWGEEASYIRIADDGLGMDENELIDAMRIGSKNPLDPRDDKALGRFGMGLKTASFSLGKRLTVMTKKAGIVRVRCWDLDTVVSLNDWTLLKSPIEDSLKRLGDIDSPSGTIVLIEKLDRLIAPPYNERKRKKFVRQMTQIEAHLEMVFHRYLEGTGRIALNLNGQLLVPWDPFMAKHLSTTELSSTQISVDDSVITVQPYVLPHHNRLTKDEYTVAGGSMGWSDQQGFYVYRNKRLLVAGGWLHLFPKEESAKLARICVDIQNDTDFEWQIDVKKSVARPPHDALEPLRRIGENAREFSRKVYYMRGVNNPKLDGKPTQQLDFLWEQSLRRNRPHFLINQRNPLLVNIKEQCSPQVCDMIDVYLKHLQELCPANTLGLTPQFDDNVEESIPEQIKEEIIKIYSVYKTMDISESEAAKMLQAVPLFSEYTFDAIYLVIQEGEKTTCN